MNVSVDVTYNKNVVMVEKWKDTKWRQYLCQEEAVMSLGRKL
jgi:hypothetical protein